MAEGTDRNNSPKLSISAGNEPASDCFPIASRCKLLTTPCHLAIVRFHWQL